jgi:hypothetical protein
MEETAFPGIPWPPRPGDYAHVNATGETARVVEVRDDGYGLRFTIELLPRRGEHRDPQRLIRRTCALDKLSPEMPPAGAT